jgi:hypothetical protein
LKGVDKMNEEEIVSIYKVEDELTGNMLKALLEKEGIPAILRSFQIPSYDSVMTLAVGAWGDIQVMKKHAERAIKIINEYMKSWNKNHK